MIGPAASILSPSPMPPTARKRREAGAGARGCDCRADALLLWASPSVRVDFAQHASSPAGLSPLPSVRIPTEGREVEDEHQTQRRSAQTGELNRGSAGRRLSPAIDAQRRVNGRRRDGPGIGARQVGPRDPRYEDMTHWHD